MGFGLNTRNIIQCTVNGTLGINTCIVCLNTLDGYSENIFTEIHRDGIKFSVADILNVVCDVQFTGPDIYRACYNCFVEASIAYKFYLKSKRSEEIISNYIANLHTQLSVIDTCTLNPDEALCVFLNEYHPITPELNYKTANIDLYKRQYELEQKDVKEQKKRKTMTSSVGQEFDENIIMYSHDSGVIEFYKMTCDGSLVQIVQEELAENNSASRNVTQPGKNKNNTLDKKKKNERRKRLLMSYKVCPECPIKYRYSAKLKEHMKTVHNIDLFVCKVCKALFSDERDFCLHLCTHTNVYTCDICSLAFKKRTTIISHLRRHEEILNMGTQSGAHICELCGKVLPDKESLLDHFDKKHDKKYMCFYCGKTYKGEISFEAHIKKHEKISSQAAESDGKEYNYEITQWLETDLNDSSNITLEVEQKPIPSVENSKYKGNFLCETCNRGFVDARALMWHQRLHTNEKPYPCSVCGKSFVTLNRRNQHTLCAHSAPTRRCPLCPALFHLRSMVNTHIRKVHLNFHKRRHRVSKHHNVHWKTEPVPIQDLSIPVQNQLLELRTKSIL